MNTRYDLIPAQGIEEVSKVLTKKLEKFNINQWKYGISWAERETGENARVRSSRQTVPDGSRL